MRWFPVLPFLALPCIACAQSVDLDAAVASITEEDFLRKVGIIAHDSMAGRDTPSPGLEMTAAWIADEFRRYGLEPGGDDGGFLQYYTVQLVVPDLEGSAVTASTGVGLEFGTDLGFLFGVPVDEDVNGGVVLVTGSLTDDEEVVPESVRGKHLIIVPPTGAREVPRRTQFSLMSALAGARPASLVVVTRQSEGDWKRAAALQGERGQTRTPWGGNTMPAILSIRGGSFNRLLAGSGFRLPSRALAPNAPFALHTVPGLELTLSPRARVLNEFRAPNVVGILEGSDPELKREYVVYSGHMDHVGVGAPDQTGDSIYNGADDDASGTVLVVEAAEAFSLLRPAPKRSIIFLAVSGEEKGLWGSDFFAEFPPVPISRMVANLNADMVGRNWPDTIVAIGKEHSDLGATLARVNAAHPELNMTAIGDRWPEQDFYHRSDHFHFARRGVPVLFFFNGVHEDYHRPSDEVESLDAEKAARIAQLVFYLGAELANATDRPIWEPESYAEIVELSEGGS